MCSTERQQYLWTKATEAGFSSIDEYIKFLKSQQPNLQPIYLPEKPKPDYNPANYVLGYLFPDKHPKKK